MHGDSRCTLSWIPNHHLDRCNSWYPAAAAILTTSSGHPSELSNIPTSALHVFSGILPYVGSVDITTSPITQSYRIACPVSRCYTGILVSSCILIGHLEFDILERSLSWKPIMCYIDLCQAPNKTNKGYKGISSLSRIHRLHSLPFGDFLCLAFTRHFTIFPRNF